jgi:hypothetical protein
MRSVVDDIRAEVETRAGSEESRALIINRLVLENFDWNTYRYRVYREDTIHKQMILRGTHPDFPDLIDLYSQDRRLLAELNAFTSLQRMGVKYTFGERAKYLDRQQQIEEERKRLKLAIRAMTNEILGMDCYQSKRRATWGNFDSGPYKTLASWQQDYERKYGGLICDPTEHEPRTLNIRQTTLPPYGYQSIRGCI